MGERFVLRQVIDGDHFEEVSEPAIVDRLHHLATDAAEAIDTYLNCHCDPPPLRSRCRMLLRLLAPAKLKARCDYTSDRARRAMSIKAAVNFSGSWRSGLLSLTRSRAAI